MPSSKQNASFCWPQRFDRIGLLVGHGGLTRLWKASVTVVGLGGVGSFAAEALARSGIGKIRLIDFDEVCITNSNRQLQALQNTIGRPKADVLAERLKLINPELELIVEKTFFSQENADELLSPKPDFLIDAIDNFTAKCHLIAECKKRSIPLVVSTGAASRFDPTAIQIADLGRTHTDPMAQAVRRILRKKYNFPKNGNFGIPAVFSTEKPTRPRPFHYREAKEIPSSCPPETLDASEQRDSQLPNGTFVFVTGTFGLTCASVAIRHILDNP